MAMQCSTNAPVELNEYIAVGCLSFDANDQYQIPSPSPDFWTEIEHEHQHAWSDQTRSSLQILMNAHWIRSFHRAVGDRHIWRIYILPLDVARASVPRESKLLKNILDAMIENLDTSISMWLAASSHAPARPFDKWATAEGDSLHYIFNTLPSPAPNPSIIANSNVRADCHCLLDLKSNLRGLETQLYPYQRRTAACMVQRENVSQAQLDPRLEARTGPDGNLFYFGPREKTFFKHPRTYDAIRGGILAETMGLGKTLICIAVICTTLGQLPPIPPQCEQPELPIRRDGPASLQHMAAAATHRHQIPWKGLMQDIKEREGEDLLMCRAELERMIPSYEMPPTVVRSSRNATILAKPVTMLLSSATIVVVPRNLVHQWSMELEKHVKADALQILVVDRPKILLPAPEDLAKYDVILFSRPRFELEGKMTDDFYESPLKRIHFLRVIIDEGHNLASANTQVAVAAQKLVKADRRWIVSGTPAKDLLGVEVELGSMKDDSSGDREEYRQKSLARRKSYDAHEEQRSGAIKALGLLAAHFLQAQPWAVSGQLQLEQAANWDDHIYRHESDRGRTYSSFSSCLRRCLEGLVVKTQPSDVERDLNLPPLTHSVVRLVPSLFDKLSANLFVLLFTANAVTSERKDQDYLFHKNSVQHLHRLIVNLHRSSFSWTGFQEQDVLKSLDVADSYLSKEGTLCSEEDRSLMIDTMKTARYALEIAGWLHLSRGHEMGVFVTEWPDRSKQAWTVPGCDDPMLLGLTSALSAQKHVNERLSQADPLADFDTYGAAVMTAAHPQVEQGHDDDVEDDVSRGVTAMPKLGVPPSSMRQDLMGTKRLSVSGVAMSSPKKSKKPLQVTQPTDQPPGQVSPSADTGKRSRRRRLSIGNADIELSPESALGRLCVQGTTSSKLTYLLDRVLELHETEKILIFYDAEYIAYYMSQALDLFHVKHLIYASSLSGEQRSKYVVLFNTDSAQRVLLMDLRQAAHGLNLSSASRVFFINPAYRPDVEAQAIKRAHRIGQTRPVHVETLVLSGTVEEAVHNRASKMTQSEHRAARTLEEDEGIRGIIQSARVIPVSKEEMYGPGQIARLRRKQQIFGRPGRKKGKQSGLEQEVFGPDDDKESGGVKRHKTGAAKGRIEAKSSSKVRKSEGRQQQAEPKLGDLGGSVAIGNVNSIFG